MPREGFRGKRAAGYNSRICIGSYKSRCPEKAVAERGLRDTIIEICTESYKSRCPEKAVAERDQQGYSTENFVRSYRSRCPNKAVAERDQQAYAEGCAQRRRLRSGRPGCFFINLTAPL